MDTHLFCQETSGS